MRKTAMASMLARVALSCVTALLGAALALSVSAADFDTVVITDGSKVQLEQRVLVPPEEYLPPEEVTAPQAPGPIQTLAVGPTYRVYATREGLVGQQTANGHIIAPNDHFVALPSSSVLNGNGGYTYTVTVVNPANGRQASNVPVWDLGPWNVTDNYWHSPRVSKFASIAVGTPAAAVQYQNGWVAENGWVPSNPAGIDLADGTWNDLGGSDGYVDVTFNWETPPPPTYADTYHAQSYPSTMVAGSTATAWAEFTNTGTAHWAHGSTRLGTSSPQDRSSPFYNAGNWIAANRPSDVDQTDVAQNQVGRFTFILKAPTTPGTYTEHFKLVREGVAWFGSEITWVITVTAAKGNITGTVTNSYNNQPISGATVTISGVASTSTDSSGVYTLANLNPATYTLNVSAGGYGSTSGTATVTIGQTTTRNFSLTSTDATAPNAPTGLGASSVSPSQINLAWSGSTDSGGSGLAGYIVYRGGSEIGRTTATTFANNGLVQNTTYSYYVKAYDNAGNVSAASNTATATTQLGTVPIFEDGFANTNYWQALVEGEMPGPYPPSLVADNHDHAQFPGVNSLKTLTSDNGKQGCLIGHTFDTPFAAARFESYFFDGTGLGYVGNFEAGTEGWASYPSAYGTLTTASGGVSGNCLSISDGGWTGGSYKEYTSGFAAGETYWLNISEKVPAAGTWGTAPYVFVRFMNSSGAIIGTDNTVGITVDNAWHGYALTGTIPAGAAKIWIGQYMYLNATSTYTYCVDNVSFTTSTDVKTNLSRQGLQVRCVSPDDTVHAIYYVGTYNVSPGATAKYSAGYYKLGTVGWLWPLAQMRDRSPGWHKFAIDFLPYTGAGNEVHFYIDGVDVGQVERTIDTQTYGLNMVAYGYHYRVSQTGWFDDCAMYAAQPVAPTMGTPTALSTSAIRWNLTDHSNNEMGFRIENAAQATVATAAVSNGVGGAVWADETGLAPNTSCTRFATAFNGTLDSSASASATRWTLSAAPSASNVTCNRAAGSSSSSPDFTFTAVGGFGQGTVGRYRYVWDTNPTHAWTESEAIWDSGQLMIQASSSGTYYLHVKSYNGEGVANGTLDLGPYGYQSGPVVDKIATALALTDGTPIWFQGKPVTATLPGAFYIEDPDRTSGIKVVSGATVARGDLVNIYGAPGMSGVQRAFIASYVAKTGTGAVPKPLFMTTRAIGGSSPTETTPGTTDGRSLYNIGLLARVTGHVTYSNSTDPSNRYFYINDGCGISDGSGHLGVLVRCGSINPPSTGMVAATGVVGLEQAGTKYVPVVIIRDASDLRAF